MRGLTEWAARNNITPEQLRELVEIMESVIPAYSPGDGKTEQSGAQQPIMLEAPKHGIRLFRNNIGACVDQEGNFVRYGLANMSKAQNQKIKSGDLIGITPTVITQEMVGGTLGVFTSIECKRPGWRWTGTEREQAQLKWAELIISLGGFAQFATGPRDIWNND